MMSWKLFMRCRRKLCVFWPKIVHKERQCLARWATDFVTMETNTRLVVAFYRNTTRWCRFLRIGIVEEIFYLGCQNLSNLFEVEHTTFKYQRIVVFLKIGYSLSNEIFLMVMRISQKIGPSFKIKRLKIKRNKQFFFSFWLTLMPL